MKSYTNHKVKFIVTNHNGNRKLTNRLVGVNDWEIGRLNSSVNTSVSSRLKKWSSLWVQWMNSSILCKRKRKGRVFTQRHLYYAYIRGNNLATQFLYISLKYSSQFIRPIICGRHHIIYHPRRRTECHALPYVSSQYATRGKVRTSVSAAADAEN